MVFYFWELTHADIACIGICYTRSLAYLSAMRHIPGCFPFAEILQHPFMTKGSLQDYIGGSHVHRNVSVLLLLSSCLIVIIMYLNIIMLGFLTG